MHTWIARYTLKSIKLKGIKNHKKLLNFKDLIDNYTHTQKTYHRKEESQFQQNFNCTTKIKLKLSN